MILISKYPVILPPIHPAFCFSHSSSAILPCALEHSAWIWTNVKSDVRTVNTVFSADFEPWVVNALSWAATSFIENIMQAHRSCCWLCKYQSLLISCYMGRNKTIIINYDRKVYVCTGSKSPLLFFFSIYCWGTVDCKSPLHFERGKEEPNILALFQTKEDDASLSSQFLLQEIGMCEVTGICELFHTEITDFITSII